MKEKKRYGALACGALVIIGAVGFGFDQMQRREALERRISELEAELALRQPPHHTGAPRLSGLDARSERKDVEALKDELLLERDLREKAERQAKINREWADELEGEVVIAFGKVEQVGDEFGALFKDALAVSEAERNGELDTPENQVRVTKFLRNASSFSGLSEAVIRFDGEPEDGGRFFAATYKSVFDLDDGTARTLEEMFKKQIAAADEHDLTLRHLPIINGLVDGVPIEQQKDEAREWLRRRQAFYRDFRAELREQIPPDKREQFDQWVEVDGIGFNNISFRGQSVGFTLGGKQ